MFFPRYCFSFQCKHFILKHFISKVMRWPSKFTLKRGEKRPSLLYKDKPTQPQPVLCKLFYCVLAPRWRPQFGWRGWWGRCCIVAPAGNAPSQYISPHSLLRSWFERDALPSQCRCGGVTASHDGTLSRYGFIQFCLYFQVARSSQAGWFLGN